MYNGLMIEGGPMGKAIYGLWIFVCTMLLWTGAGIANPNLDLMVAVTASAMEDNIQFLPFEIPLQMSTGSSLFFPNAISVRSFRYTGGEKITVYQYHSFETAKKDLEALPFKDLLKKGDSLILEGNNMVFAKCNEQASLEAFFLLDSYIVGILLKENEQARKTMISTGEKIVATYDKYLEKFLTPEKCVLTFVKAIEDADPDLIMDALFFPTTASGNAYKKMIMMLFNGMVMARQSNESFRDIVSSTIKLGKIEAVSDSEAKVEIVQGIEKLMLTRFFGFYSGGETWVPLKKVGRKWMIDMEQLKKLQFAYSEAHVNRAKCISNLKQIGLMLKMYAQDHKGAYPEDIRNLPHTYLPNPDILRCPDDKTITGKIQKLTPSTEISYEYVSGLKEGIKDAQNIILLYDKSLDFHQEGRNVLFLAGNVKWMKENEFQRLLKNQPKNSDSSSSLDK